MTTIRRSATNRRSALRLAATALLTGAVAAGSLVFAPVAQAAVANPSNVTGLAVNATTIQVQWRDNSSTENRYSVRLTDQSTFQLLSFDAAAVAGSGANSALTITDLAAGHTYRPTVCAMATASNFSPNCTQGANITLAGGTTTTTAPPPPAPPAAVAAPTNIGAARVGASTVRMTWSHPGGATRFRTFVRVAPNGNWMLASVDPGTSRQSIVAPLLINTNYHVAVCAVNAADLNFCSGIIPVFLAQGF